MFGDCWEFSEFQYFDTVHGFSSSVQWLHLYSLFILLRKSTTVTLCLLTKFSWLATPGSRPVLNSKSHFFGNTFLVPPVLFAIHQGCVGDCLHPGQGLDHTPSLNLGLDLRLLLGRTVIWVMAGMINVITSDYFRF